MFCDTRRAVSSVPTAPPIWPQIPPACRRNSRSWASTQGREGCRLGVSSPAQHKSRSLSQSCDAMTHLLPGVRADAFVLDGHIPPAEGRHLGSQLQVCFMQGRLSQVGFFHFVYSLVGREIFEYRVFQHRPMLFRPLQQTCVLRRCAVRRWRTPRP